MWMLQDWDGLELTGACNTLVHEYMDRTADSIGRGAGRAGRSVVCGGLGGAADSRLAWYGLWGNPGESVSGDTAERK